MKNNYVHYDMLHVYIKRVVYTGQCVLHRVHDETRISVNLKKNIRKAFVLCVHVHAKEY